MSTGYDYEVQRSLAAAKDLRAAIEITVFNYFHDQLGWSGRSCRERVLIEEKRTIPKAVLDELALAGWDCEGKRVLDVGAGQGGMLLELLDRGADAYGIEPGKEFAALCRRRLQEAGHDPLRISEEPAESLPFSNDSFDYVISLQVLEHLPDPAPVFLEIFRVLTAGGECHLVCDNYLSFSEPHYRVRWLPLLPKTLGSVYLRIIGRDPKFLKKYIYYTTYPQIWRICSQVGFTNVTYKDLWQKFDQPSSIRTAYIRTAAHLLHVLPQRFSKRLVHGYAHLNHFWRPGVRVTLQKPLTE
ncbi:MAG TPA: methyltransferase domain-containing protein [Blastocatellia bacterium]|nr:methyltransferase domain-containing protein [Blastocatellia bacterium]